MRTALNLNSINRSLGSLSTTVKSAVKRSEGIDDSIRKNIIAKKESISISQKLFAKRRDLQRRREKEDLLEAGGVMGALKAGSKIIQRKTKGFLGRILDFIGTIIIGWAILNLPKIIKIAEDLIKRVQKYFGVLSSFVNSVATMFRDLGDRLKEISVSLLPFNFTAFQDQITSFMAKIRNAFDQLVLNTIKTIKVFSDKSERELAEEIGLADVFDQMNNQGETPTEDDGKKDNERGSGVDGEEEEGISNSDLIKQGLVELRKKRGGELTKNDINQTKGKSNLEIHQHLVNEDIVLFRNTKTDQLGYMSYDEYIENFNNSPLLESVPFDKVPYKSDYEASFFSEEYMSDEDIEKLMELEDQGIYGDDAMDIIEGRKKLIDFKPPDEINNIEIEVPIQLGRGNGGVTQEEQISSNNPKYQVDTMKNRARHQLDQ